MTPSVSNNTQQASALGNTATNTLMLSPGVTPTVTVEECHHLTAAADRQHPVDFCSQMAGVETPVAVSATSNMQIGAPMAMTGSTLAISGNSNTASAVVNDVTNALTVNGTSSLPGTDDAERRRPGQHDTLGIQANGDYTVVNSQTVASGTVQSTATTSILNKDLYLDPGAVAGTSVSVDSNTTVAQSLGNRASNTLTITAAGPSAATGAVANGQINGAAIGAAAMIDTTFALGQATGLQVRP